MAVARVNAGGRMEDRSKQPKKPDQVKDLPGKAVTPEKAGEVKGGAMRAGGDDDDLEELEVQR